MNDVTYPETAQRSAQELHEAIVAHNEAMKIAMLKLISGGIGENNISDAALDASILICQAMADLMCSAEAPETE